MLATATKTRYRAGASETRRGCGGLLAYAQAVPTGADDLPDFVRPYDVHPLTPLMAAKLWYVADSVEGTYFDGMSELDRGPSANRSGLHR